MDHETPSPPSARTRPLRCFLVGSGTVLGLQDALRHEYDAWRRPLKADPISWRAKCHATLELLVLNLITFNWSDPSLWIQVQANKDWYSHNRFWIPHFLTKDTVMVCRRFLVETDYAEETIGKASLSARFRQNAAIRALPKFTRMVTEVGVERGDVVRSPADDLIHLKAAKDDNGSKRRIAFTMTPDLQQKSDNAALINLHLIHVHADMKLTRIQEARMMAAIVAKADCQHVDDDAELMLDRTQKVVYRVYNNGSFDQGGRFYGPWWQSVPQMYRKHITINGKRTVEVDYSAMHPTILGNRLGLRVPGNFYEIGIGTKALVKQTFNALLNAKRTSLKAIDGFDEGVVGMTWAAFLNAVRNHYDAFRSYFGTGEGLKLQRIDADIAEAVMLRCAKLGNIVLPIHDSFLSTEDRALELAKVMEEEFERVTGGPIKLSEKVLADIDRTRVAEERRRSPHLYRDYHDRVRQGIKSGG